jgi:hypothetical protein
MKAGDETRFTAAQMKPMRTAAKHIWLGYKRNEDILKELREEPILDSILNCKSNWVQHVDRM